MTFGFFDDFTVWTIAGPYLLISLLLKRPKPTSLVICILAFVVLYPLTWLLSVALKRVKSREGRIRLEEEAVLSREEEEVARRDGAMAARGEDAA